MQITLQGSPIHTVGELPPLNSKAPDFTLVKTDLNPITLQDLKGQYIVLNIFVSIDTSVCATSVKKFNQDASKYPNTTVICVSMDLAFAQQRFCAAQNIDNVISASAFRNPEFGKDYGVTITDGPLSQLLSRAAVVIDPDQKIIYREQVVEMTHEPDYEAVYKCLQEAQSK